MIDWEDLHAFGAVLEAGSLSAAARRLRVTQPTMRRRLDALEREVGGALFTRSQAGLIPTEAARELGRHAQAMGIAADAFARAASADAECVAGTVRITASDVVGAEVLPPILATLREQHPRLALEINLNNRTEDLLRREADLAVRMVRPSQDALVIRRIGAIPLGLFAHQDYLARHTQPRTVADLAGHALIGPDRVRADLDWLADRGIDLRDATFALRTDSQLAQLAAIRARLGIGICQVAIARRDPALQRVLADRFAHAMETWVAMHEDLRRVRRARLVFDHLAAGMVRYAAA